MGKWKRKPHDKQGDIWLPGERFAVNSEKVKRYVEYYADGRVFTGTFSKHGPYKEKLCILARITTISRTSTTRKSYFEGSTTKGYQVMALNITAPRK